MGNCLLLARSVRARLFAGSRARETRLTSRVFLFSHSRVSELEEEIATLKSDKKLLKQHAKKEGARAEAALRSVSELEVRLTFVGPNLSPPRRAASPATPPRKAPPPHTPRTALCGLSCGCDAAWTVVSPQNAPDAAPSRC